MPAKWYIVHAYSNFEKKVAEAIRSEAAQKGMSENFEEIVVPTEEVTEIRKGRKVNTERKYFPGYVLVKMDMTDEAYHLVKNTPKVTGFLGSGARPLPVPRIGSPSHHGADGRGCGKSAPDHFLRDRRDRSRHRRPLLQLQRYR